ncbi:SGNH/GDSL hydrolase family protein [Listeria aquatica]|uniref:SGNH/GDSL hydrolase family protein n=1 Tax=Listeria aquatica TaxID=1494960 RepID=A0A841ZIP6_9LIST|nr:SGNH/GDSL hydrolase family protein [Listeria aquatica]MBC1520589.1 SGNH/GDSL hydrolase family protein [Listeria aquatica]
MTKKRLLVLLVAVLILLAIIFGGFWLKEYLDQKKEEEKTPISLVAMGDSLTEGDGDEKKAGGYVGILDKSLTKHQEVRSVETSNHGVSGNRSDQLLKRLKTEPDFQKAVQKANVITMTIGGNDVMKVLQSKLLDVKVSDFTKAEENFQKNLTEVFSLIRENNPNAPIFLVGVYNPYTTYFSQIKQFDEVITNWNSNSQAFIKQQKNAYFVPIAQLIENRDKKNRDKPNPLLSDDYFHPNHTGYEKIAHKLDSTIIKELKAGKIPKKKE